MRAWLTAVAVAAIAVLAWQGSRLDAHITVKSRSTFHRDVRPILERRCLQCHTAGGVAPTSLRTYEEALAQSWPLRQALMSGRMPPWSAESSLMALQEQQALTARELDVLMTWAAGGTPEGTPEDGAAIAPANAPAADAVISMPKPFVLSGAMREGDHEVALPSAGLAGKWIGAVTVLPGSPAIARRAEIAIRSRGGEQIIGLWLPGDAPQRLSGNGAFLVPKDGSLRLRMHYQHPRPELAPDLRDQSRVGVYFARGPAAQIQQLAIVPGRQQLNQARRIVAVRPLQAPANAAVVVTIIPPGGGPAATLIRFIANPAWPRRYAFVAPVELATGSTIDVVVTPARTALWQALLGPSNAAVAGSLVFRATLETVE